MLTENGELGYIPKDLKYKEGPFIDDVGIFGRGGENAYRIEFTQELPYARS